MTKAPKSLAGIVFATLFVMNACASQPKAKPQLPGVTVAPSSLSGPTGDLSHDTEKLIAGKRGEQAPKLPNYMNIPPIAAEGHRQQRMEEALPFDQNKQVHVAFDKMPLNDFVHHIFADVLAVNYIAADQIAQMNKPVTMNLKQPTSERQVFTLTKDVLAQEGLDVLYKDGLFYIGPKGQRVAGAVIGIGRQAADIPQSTGEILQIVPVQYGDINDLMNLLAQVLKINAVPYLKENVMAVRGSRAQVESALDFVSLVDRPAMRGRHLALITLSHWNVNDFVPQITDALVQEGIPVAGKAGQGGLYFLPVEKLGGFVVFSAEQAWLARVRSWVHLLDVPNQSMERSFYVYKPESATAKDLGKSLATILKLPSSGADRQKGGAQQQQQKMEPLTAQVTEVTGSRAALPMGGTRAGAAKAQMTAAAQKRGGPAGAVGSVGMEDVASPFGPGTISFSVDESRNALVFYTTAVDYQQILQLLKKLDEIPLQVALDACVIEVTLTDKLSLGVEWLFKNTTSLIGGKNPEQAYSIGTDLGLTSGAFNFIGLFNGGDIQVTLSMLAKDQLIKVLSNPKLTVRDGKTAQIVVGTEVPVITAETTASDISGSILRSVQYRSTGVSLSVTPTVNARGVITLEINQEVSEASTNDTSDIDSPLILSRSIHTEVVTGDGQTVFLGGLIKENKSHGKDQVPGVGDIPILGTLFRKNSDSRDRTELIVLITPRIIESTERIDAVRREFLRGFQQINYLESLKNPPVINVTAPPPSKEKKK